MRTFTPWHVGNQALLDLCRLLIDSMGGEPSARVGVVGGGKDHRRHEA